MRILIAIPAYNEAVVLEATLAALTFFCKNNFTADDWQIVVVDNASKDATAAIIKGWQAKNVGVDYLSMPTPGKGEAVLGAWQSRNADVYCFMDADLATDLAALPKLIAAISGGADVALGSRALPQSRVDRSALRRFVSTCYRQVARFLVGTSCSDLPCGFKAINQKTKDTIVPVIENTKWFFDSELVLRAEWANYKIVEVPIDWAERRGEGSKSKVNIFSVARAYVQELWRMRKLKSRSNETI